MGFWARKLGVAKRNAQDAAFGGMSGARFQVLSQQELTKRATKTSGHIGKKRRWDIKGDPRIRSGGLSAAHSAKTHHQHTSE